MTELDHPCRDTCSGWKQGYERGAQDLTVAYMSGFEAAKDKYEAREKVLVEALRFYAKGYVDHESQDCIAYALNRPVRERPRVYGHVARKALKQLGAVEEFAKLLLEDTDEN